MRVVQQTTNLVMSPKNQETKELLSICAPITST